MNPNRRFAWLVSSACAIALLAPATLEKFLTEKNLDFALEMPAAEAPQRFRVNFLMSGHSMAACFRVIPNRIPNFKWAGFPEDLAHRLAIWGSVGVELGLQRLHLGLRLRHLRLR
jgi:Tfp pilus assembly pilus retraction ATPase PilT